jgi:hypothetical protein
MLQAQTMEMMYTIITDELKSMDNKDMRPEDYLSFFCLGNREEPPSNGSLESEKSTDKSAAVVCCCIFPYSFKEKLSRLFATKTYLTACHVFIIYSTLMYILILLVF